MDKKLIHIIENREDIRNLLANMSKDIKIKLSIVKFEKGEMILEKSSEITHVYIQVEGAVYVLNEFEDGKRYILAKHEPVDLVADMAVLAGKKYAPVAVEAIDECTLIKMTKDDFLNWMENDNKASYWEAQMLAKKMYPVSQKRGSHNYQPAIVTLKEFIVEECANNLRTSEFAVVEKTRTQMSDELGISKRTIDRNIKTLKDKNQISIFKGKILVTKNQMEDLMREF